MALTARSGGTAHQRRPLAATHSTRVLPELAADCRTRGEFPPGQIVPPRITPIVDQPDFHRDVAGARRSERVASSPR
jgi:hypothetical protein